MAEEKFLDRYLLDRDKPLGAGAMGQVYRAHDTRLACPVAIKMMNREIVSDNEARRRFFWEASAAARFRDHPNIVTILDYDVTQEGEPFIVMEFLEGVNLKQRLQQSSPAELPSHERRRFSFKNRLEILVQVCHGLARAHRRGHEDEEPVIHRDIKPENIFITSEGPTKILDFGVARVREATTNVEGMIIGTLPYMSPEQLAGSSNLDGRSDIWSTGVVLYEVIGYRRPFQGEMIPLVDKIRHKPYPPLTQFLPACAKELEQIVDRALAKEPIQRFSTAEEMANSLTGFLRLLDSQEREMSSKIKRLQEDLQNWRYGADSSKIPLILEGAIFAAGMNPDDTILMQKPDYGAFLEIHNELFRWFHLLRDEADKVDPLLDLFSKTAEAFESGNVASCMQLLDRIQGLDSGNPTAEKLAVKCGWILGQPSNRHKELIDAEVSRWRADQQIVEIYSKARRILEKAETSLKEEHYPAAIETLTQLSDVSPELPPAIEARANEIRTVAGEASRVSQKVAELLEAAKAALEAEDVEAAVEATEQILRLKPDHDEGRLLHEEAESVLEKMRQIEDLLTQAHRAQKAKDYASVSQLTQRVLALEGSHSEAARLRQEAEEVWARQQRVEELTASARASLEAQNYEDCLEVVAKGLELDSENEELLALERAIQEIRSLREQGWQPEEPAELQQLENRTKVAERLAEAWAAFGSADFQRCLRALTEGLKLDPENEELIQLRARTKVAQCAAAASESLEAEDYEDCLETVKKGLELDPENEELVRLRDQAEAGQHFTAAQIAFEARDYSRCLEAVAEGLELDPEHKRLLRLRDRTEAREWLVAAQTAFEARDLAGCQEALEEGLKLDPELEELLRLRDRAKVAQFGVAAQAALAARDYPGCLKAVAEGLKLDPDHEELRRLQNRAQVAQFAVEAQEAFEAKTYTSCLEAAAEGLKLDPEHPNSCEFEEGALRSLSGRVGGAQLRSLSARKGSELDSQDLLRLRDRARAGERFVAAQAAFEARDYPGCLETVAEGLKLDPEHEELLRLRDRAKAWQRWVTAQAALEAKDYAACLAATAEGLKLDPEHEELLSLQNRARVAQYTASARAAFDQGNFPESLQAIAGGLKLAPEHEELLDLLDRARSGERLLAAQTALEAKDYQGCLEAVAEGLKLDPENEAMQQLRIRAQAGEQLLAAQAALEADDYSGCLDAVAEGLSLDPEHEALLRLRDRAQVAQLAATARIALEAGDYDACLESLSRGLELDTEDEELLALKQAVQQIRDLREQAEAPRDPEELQRLENRAKVAERLAEAWVQFGAADFDACLEAVAEGLTLDPDNEELPQLQTRAKLAQFTAAAQDAFGREDHPGTLETIAEGLKLDPDNEALQELRIRTQVAQFTAAAQDAFERGDQPGTLRASAQGLELDPDNEALQELQIRSRVAQCTATAQDAFEREDYLAVQKTTTEGLQLDPSNQTLQQLRIRSTVSQCTATAREAFEREDYARALEQVAEGLELDPANEVLQRLRNRAKIAQFSVTAQEAFEHQDYLKVLELAEEGLKLNSENEALRLLRSQAEKVLAKVKKLLTQARQLFQQKDYPDVLEVLEKILALDPQNNETLRIKQEAAARIEERVSVLLGEAEEDYQARNYAACLKSIGEALPLAQAAVERALTMDRECRRLEELQELAQRESKKIEETIARLLRTAREQLKTEDYRKALKTADSILDLDHTNVEANQIKKRAEASIVPGPPISPLVKLGAILTAVLILAYTGWQAWNYVRVSQIVALAAESLEAGDYPACLSAVADGLELDPGNEQLQQFSNRCRVPESIATARAALKAEDYSTCLKAVADGLELDPENEQLQQLQTRCDVPGELRLNTLPWAKVDSLLRKRDQKEFVTDCPQTPCTVSLPAGEYYLKVSKGTCGSWEFDVTIASGKVHEETRSLPGC